MKGFRQFAALVAVLVAMFALVASGDENEATSVDDNGGAEANGGDDNGGAEANGGDDAPTSFEVGETVALGDWQIVVHEFVAPVEVSEEMFAPDEGMKRVKVDAEVTNQGDEPATVSSLLCFEIKDGDNRTYSQTIGESDVGSIDGEIAPGAALRGEMEYDVPEESNEFVLDFKCDLFSSGSATIDLT